MPTRHPTIAQTALQLIRSRGPLTIDELVPLVVDAGRTKAKDPRQAVERAITDDAGLLPGWDGHWHSTVDRLEGAIFTVRPTDLEQREGVVLVRDELVLAASLLRVARWDHPQPAHLDHFSHYFDLPSWGFDIIDFDEDDRPIVDPPRTIRAWVGDARAEDLLGFLEDVGVPRGGDDEAGLRLLLDRAAGTQVIHGPRGWMPELEPRELLGLRIERGDVCAIALDRRQVAGAHVDAAAKRIAGLAHLVIGPDASWFGPPSMPVETLLAMVATEAPELLRRPLPPIRDVIRRGGLVLEHGAVRHPGTREADI